MIPKIPLCPLTFQFPILRIGDATSTITTIPTSGESFNLQIEAHVKRALHRLIRGQWGTTDDASERWFNGSRQDVEKEFAVREERLRALKAMVLVLAEVLALSGSGGSGLPIDPMACCALKDSIERAVGIWNTADMQLLDLYPELITPPNNTETEPTSSSEIVFLQDLTSSDGTTDTQCLTKLDTRDFLVERPKTLLARIPTLSSSTRVQAELNKWVNNSRLMSDVDWLVALCNEHALIGKKSWDDETVGESSRAQAYNRIYRQKKGNAIESIRTALSVALQHGSFPPVQAVIVLVRVGIESWNALSKEVQRSIDEENERYERFKKLPTFLPLSPVQTSPSFITPVNAPPPTPSSWLSNDDSAQRSSRPSTGTSPRE